MHLTFPTSRALPCIQINFHFLFQCDEACLGLQRKDCVCDSPYTGLKLLKARLKIPDNNFSYATVKNLVYMASL